MLRLFAIIGALLLVSSLSAQKMSRGEADTALRDVVEQWMRHERERLDYITKSKMVVHDDLQMPIWCYVFGKMPSEGRNLYISLHGGGNGPKAMNDGQWQNQWYLYRPSEGVYICPRAPYDDWDMHFKPTLDAFYRDIINYAVTHLGVNPDKVYVMGYSAGGDGVWRLAPRMADTWAAASMMAGHPGSVRLENLRNLPFMIWCGGNDAAYNRNTLCASRITQLDSLRADDGEGYIHEGHIIEGKGHWMDQADTTAVSWMAQYRRNPYPKKMVWRQEEVTKDRFYWVSIDSDEAKEGKELRLSIKDNVITIDRCDYKSFTLWLNDNLADLDKKIIVRKGKKNIFTGKVERRKENIEETLKRSNDVRYAFPAKVKLNNTSL